MSVGRFAARVGIGGLFIGHGTQKLKGWFDGPGLEGTETMMASLNMHPPRRNALAAGVTETAGGALLVLGLATPLASASLIGTMITAIRKVHLPNGPWAAKGGWEYNAVLIAALVALAETGPGVLSPGPCPRSGTIRNHVGFGRTRPGCCSFHGRHRGRQPLRADLRSRHQRGVVPSHHRGRPDHQRITHR